MKQTKISRRSFLLGLGAVSTAALLTACGEAASSAPASSAASSEAPASSASEVPAAPILTEDEFPVTDGSTACIPLMAQMKADVTGMDLLEAQTSITISSSRLIMGAFLVDTHRMEVVSGLAYGLCTACTVTHHARQQTAPWYTFDYTLLARVHKEKTSPVASMCRSQPYPKASKSSSLKPIKWAISCTTVISISSINSSRLVQAACSGS